MNKLFSLRTIILAGALLLQLNTLCYHSRGAAGDVDLSFDPGSGVNGRVNAVVVQPDGKVIIGGEFTTVKGLARSGLARLNAGGSGDSSFNPGAMPCGFISLGLQSDGKVLVGNYSGILRLNADGSQDTNFAASLIQIADGFGGFTAAVYSIAVQADGKILIGGDFYSQNGTNTIYGLARLNANGSLDLSFHYRGPLSGANALAVQPDGKVLFITSFNTLARLNGDGTPDATFHASNETGSASVMSLQPGGKILVAGYFMSGTSYGIARLNGNGSLDGSFNPSLPPYEGYPFVGSLAAQSDGKVLFAGGFTIINGTNRYGVARLNADGSLDSGFNPGTGANDSISLAALQPDGKVLIGGNNGIVRVNANGTLDGSFQPGTELAGPFTALVLQPDGKVLIGGRPNTFVNGTNGYGSARLNADGSLDTTFISSTNFNPDLAALNQSNDCPPGYTCTTYTETTVAVVQPDGKVLLGGDFSTRVWGHEEGEDPYTLSRCFLARFHADGSPDTGFAPLVGNAATTDLRSLSVQPDGKVVVIGNFLNGTNWSSIIRINANGTLDNSFNAGTGVYGLSSVASQPDGKVLIAGHFSSVHGTIRHQIARLNANGSVDTTFDPNAGILPIGGGSITAIAVQPDGKVLIGGAFYIVTGALQCIARLNANGSLDTTFHNPSLDGNVMTVALQSDGKVLIGGDFATVNGVARPRVARLYGDSAPSLSIARFNAFVSVSWPLSAAGFVLDQSLAPTGGWSQVSFPYTTNATAISISAPTPAGNKFYRLRKL